MSIAESPMMTAEHLEVHLQRRLGSRVRDLRITHREEGIILEGRAETYYAKQLAQHATMEICSQPILANDITVC